MPTAIADATAWQRMARATSPGIQPDLEVVQRTLRVRDQGSGASASRRSAEPASRTCQRTGPRRLPIRTARLSAAAAVAQQAVDADRCSRCRADPSSPRHNRSEPISERADSGAGGREDRLSQTCSISIWISKPISASTPSSRRRCLPPIREIYSIPRDETCKLRDFPTLAHVIRFVYDRRPDLAVRSRIAPRPGRSRSPRPHL